MTAINTNVGALNARLYALGADRSQQTAMERLFRSRSTAQLMMQPA